MAKISTRKRGKKWYYSFEATEYARNGRRKRVEKGGFESKQAALEEGTKALAGVLGGNISMVSEKISLQNYLKEWLELKRTQVRPTTITNYASMLKHVNKHLGNVCLQALRPRDIDAVMLTLAKSGLSHGALTVILNTLKSALAYAVYPGELLTTNPAQYIKVPRNAPGKVVVRRIIRQEEMEKILAAYPFGHIAHIPIQVAYHTGMRIGEVSGLTWEDVDLEAGIIFVRRQIAYAPATGHIFAPPKTESSARAIPIDRELIALLRRWKSQQAANEVKHGKAYFYTYEAKDGGVWQMCKGAAPPPGFSRRAMVCTNGRGKAAMGRNIRAALARLGINAHSLRHTHATI